MAAAQPDWRAACCLQPAWSDTMQNSTDLREALRQAMRQRRTALDSGDRMRASAALADLLIGMPELSTPRLVAVYWAVRSELPLMHAVSALLRAGHELCLPLIQPDQTLHFARWQPGVPMRPNRFGIPEPAVSVTDELLPEQLDVALLPLLAFDDRGGRLGSGGGYYDRSFACMRGRPRPQSPFLLGVAYAFQQVARLPVEAWDVPLDAIVTDSRLIRVLST